MSEPKPPRVAAPSPDVSHEKTARAKKTLASMFWSVGTGIGSRLISLVSTLLVTRYIDPASYGEVSVAYIVCQVASLAASFGVGQYVSTRPHATKKELWHASVLFHGGGVVALALVYVLREPLGIAFGGKNIEPYILGYIVAAVLERITLIPESILIRDERFKTSGLINSSVEMIYSVLVIVLAMRGMGGHAIVYAGVARWGARVVMMLWVTNVREWTTPHRWDGALVREILRYGLPMTAARLSSLIARRGDNLAFSSLFGLARMGAYNLAYNLADVPATTVGERIGDVLVPSFARLPPKERPAALARSVTLVGFAVFPLAAGLSGVARPLCLFFNEEWRALDVDWMLVVLALLSISRPIEWAARVYMQVAGTTRAIMVIEWVKVVAIMAAIFGLGLVGQLRSDALGALGACVAVVLTYVVTTLVYFQTVARNEGLSLMYFVSAARKPALCAGVMWGGLLVIDRFVIAPGVAAIRPGHTGIGFLDTKLLPHWDAIVGLTAGMLVGVAIYLGMSLLLARDEIRQLIKVVRSRNKKADAEPAATAA